jgi:hypothetical protein
VEGIKTQRKQLQKIDKGSLWEHRKDCRLFTQQPIKNVNNARKEGRNKERKNPLGLDEKQLLTESEL